MKRLSRKIDARGGIERGSERVRLSLLAKYLRDVTRRVIQRRDDGIYVRLIIVLSPALPARLATSACARARELLYRSSSER